MTSAVVLAEVDLDAAPEPSPSRRRPFLAVATVLAVLALVAAAALRSAISGPPAPTAPAVTAWVTLRAVAPPAAGPATADLVVTVANHGATDATVVAVTVAGPQAAGRPTDLRPARTDAGGTAGPPPLLVPSSRIGLLAVRESLSCNGSAPPTESGAGLQVQLTLDGGDVVTAASLGALAALDGACGAAAAAAPDGSARPVEVVSARFTGRTAQLRVSGLAAGATVVGVGADGWSVPVLDGAAPDDSAADGSATTRLLTLGRPTPACDDQGTRAVVPFGLQLTVSDGGPPVTRYAVVGPDLARWLLAARAAACDLPG